ncbi:hypothetical protein L218DRAFT_939083 [Marasmius fiardii PR-910]|nr:hypothetical protein L218DRAFT_939083 [Marasmius fiardii PR-910]
MSSYVLDSQQRKRRFTENSTVYKVPYGDMISSGYIDSVRNTAISGEPMARKILDEELRRTLQAQERARARRVIHDSSPHRTAVAHPLHSKASLYPTMTRKGELYYPSRGSSAMGTPNAYARKAALDMAATEEADERARVNNNRFARVRDSLSLPYLKSCTRASPKSKPPMLNLPPDINHPARQVIVEQVYSESTPNPKLHPSTPPRKLAPVHRESPKYLAPLPPFNPYARSRADSLSALTEDRRLCYSPPPKKQSPRSLAMHVTSNRRLRRMNTVNDLFGNINQQADTLGMKATFRRP